MENPESTGPAPSAESPVVPRPRITNACEACRSAKVKCQASNQLGICKRCLDSKRECVFKTGPRTRRPRQAKRLDSSTPTNPLPPLPGPSKTFTIDIPMPPEDGVCSTFEQLRLAHEDFINRLAPGVSSGSSDDDEWGAATAATAGSAAAVPTPQRTVASALGVRPQFNLDSATSLLATFRDVMLPNFPCIVLPKEATVSDLARDRPFVLLAVLAVASSTRTLQGHSLYDEEFRKILGLKFVAGGERSVGLLEGLVVYVAWYPFHLRPKNKQAFQYIRMAVDILSDLELDQENDTDDLDIPPTPERMDQIRLYLATYFIVSHQSVSWARSRSMQYTEFTSKAIELFQRHSTLAADGALAWKARLQRLVEETNDLRRTKKNPNLSAAQAEYQTSLVLRGIESQLNEWESQIPPSVSSQHTIRSSLLSTRLFITGASLFRFPALKSHNVNELPNHPPTQEQLLATVPTLHTILDFFLSLPAGEINAFCGADWGSLILAVVLGYRLSLPLGDYPDWDHAHARRIVRFDTYLDRLCRMGDGSDSEDILAGLSPAATLRHNMDVLSASKVVIGVVRGKFRRRTQPVVSMPGSHPPVMPGSECPMLDGSAEQYYPYWDETFAANHLELAGAGGGAGVSEQQQQQQQQQYNDLWSTISMGWAQDNINFGGLE
ncbi:hypothetical protein B0T16DRAFT_319036 [Cercophora newfieldiana]|uniref:Zn(2)-C6 fungal-type domain-containing protein n=1 Tax=Cercophora newfieldiana TaxID=92897 RepID=A0AA39YRU5_9PEZI|nr:hypothetical protein B0T16DRAFT_319036 [Cercophora newfieldiana]